MVVVGRVLSALAPTKRTTRRHVGEGIKVTHSLYSLYSLRKRRIARLLSRARARIRARRLRRRGPRPSANRLTATGRSRDYRRVTWHQLASSPSLISSPASLADGRVVRFRTLFFLFFPPFLFLFSFISFSIDVTSFEYFYNRRLIRYFIYLTYIRILLCYLTFLSYLYGFSFFIYRFCYTFTFSFLPLDGYFLVNLNSFLCNFLGSRKFSEKDRKVNLYFD